MAIYVANQRCHSRKLQRSRRLLRRAVILLLPAIILVSACLFYLGRADADFGPAANYVVQSGDSLWEIARAHAPAELDVRVYVQQLRLLNQLEQSVIHAGQVLLLPTR